MYNLIVSHALKVLEFERIIERLASHCETPIGAALAEALRPSFEASEVWERLEATNEAYALLADDPPPALAALHDPRPQFERAAKGGELDGLEVYRCGVALSILRQVKTYLRSKPQGLLTAFESVLTEHGRIEERVLGVVTSGGDLLDSASPQLASIRTRKLAAAHRVVERIQSHVSGRSREWLSDPIYTVRDGRYVLPVKSEHRAKVKGIVHDTSASGATAFIEPDDVLQLGNALRELEVAEREEVRRILLELAGRLGSIADEVLAGLDVLGTLDAIFARARLAYEQRGTMPTRVEGNFIALQGAKHPLLESETVVPLDIEVGQSAGVLITGPNTGGKTVAIKTVGLAVAMSQSGLFPIALAARLGPFTSLWADIGDEQSLQQSLSTFSGHVKNISAALREAGRGALVLFDELGAGTDPAEGAALAIAILKRLKEAGCAILASTHYGELKAFAYETAGFSNAAMEFDMKSLKPTFHLRMGAAGASQALRIAERYGIPQEVVAEAREGLGQQVQNLSQAMEELDRAQKLARTAQGEADRRLTELRKTEADVGRKLKEAEERRAQARIRGAEAIEEALRQIRIEAAEIFDDLKRNPTQTGFDHARKRLRDLDAVGRKLAAEIGPVRSEPAQSGAPLRKGMSVRIEGYAQVGILIEEPNGKNATVQLGPLKMTVPVSQVLAAGQAPKLEKKPRVNLGLARAQTASTEIHLRHRRAEEANEELAKFIDDAVLAGLPSVRIVHGKGGGVLRQITRELLRVNPNVASYRDGEPGEGGAGVTIATMK